ncbi:PadR family transcriptional regulator [Saccharibacillus kuerlensis]|uniref:PadR family transcriptional regulator n=1 Tax=Saccharibacillus kuerlensis TaxID=459527 RepID=A0ABQ2KS57_9BACL|nr:PadR family transcriptional regulator [Saccharibacillus kuerlensis]GGN91726.1 PadR family transcriptional regulator [Saccharibacillus kuerlensis]
MEYVVLGLLMLRNQTLYEINKAFEQGIALFYSASYGSLQSALKKLVGQGFVEFEEMVDKGRNKKVYMITEEGKKAFHEWMESEVSTARLEVTALSKLFFLGLVEDVERRKTVVQDVINKVEEVEIGLKQLKDNIRESEVPESHQKVLTYQLATLDYGIQMHGFAKEWFRKFHTELDQREKFKS